jgi:AcrR family transcriptional regulator
VLDAAHEVFGARGYAGATMPAIAEAAGVSVKTVEAAFGTKANLLKELIDVRIAGDDEPVPIADRPEVAEMEAQADPDRLIDIYATWTTSIERRSAVVARVLADAARSTPELAALQATTVRNRHFGATAFVRTLGAIATLRVDNEVAANTVWMLIDPHVYAEMTAERGFTDEQFASWFADALRRLLLD